MFDYLQPTPLAVEVFTADHWIRGIVKTRHARLTDLLNITTETIVNVEQAEVVRLCDPQAAPVVVPLVQLAKERILFAIPHETERAMEGRQQKRLFAFVQKKVRQVLIGLPCFEVSGELHQTGDLDASEALLVTPGQFVPVTKAFIAYLLRPQASFSGEVAIVNKSHISFVFERSPGPPAESRGEVH